MQKGQSRSGSATTAGDHGQAEAHGERGEDTDLQSAGRRVRFSGIHVRANVFGEDRQSSYRLPAVKEKHSAGGRESPRADRPIVHMARCHNGGGQSEPHAARMGELLRGRNRQQGVSGGRCLRGGAGAPVVAPQAQSQAGRELSTLAPLRALRARTPESAWARRAVDEGVRCCPRAGCRKSACPVVCPAKAGVFSRRKACRGKNQNPVVWIAGWRETKTLKPIDNVSRGETTSHRAVTTVNAKVASKVSSPEGRAPNRRAKAALRSRNLIDAAPTLRRGGSDSTVTRTCRATGEALLVPRRNHRSRVDRITGSTGKSIGGERVTDGFAVALRRGNARGAKEPCCL